ncbi:hypothetical protein [Ruegeria pomeroyi]|uniref:hypothetical protein n=1 Tax=Ruegeria pomeroyi TaxID=89184 RepID=UPI001F24BE32|nr:hypothetical protein [Ruegeria pomeroyi]
MKNTLASVAMCIAISDVAIAQEPIVISCFRGPWKEVIWDRANVNFVDSLVSVGFSLGNAQGIAERICRDPQLVDDPEAMIRKLRSIMATYTGRE